MNARELAAEIYLMPHHKREARLATIPYPERADVLQYLENMAKAARKRHPSITGHPWQSLPACKKKGD